MDNIRIYDGIGLESDVRILFKEYTEMIIKNNQEFNEYLKLQSYEDELLHLDKKYGRPYGRLYLLYCDNLLAGCIALKKIDNVKCEMKRLFLRDEFRGKGLGYLLIKRIIDEAKDIGY